MTRPARILLVDDEPAIQRSVGLLLRARGYEVEIAGTGAEALKIAAALAPDLIVLDLGLARSRRHGSLPTHSFGVSSSDRGAVGAEAPKRTR